MTQHQNELLLVGVSLIIIVALTVWVYRHRESYQSGSRFSVGGIAGPAGLYGYDPVMEYAQQLERMRQ